MACTPRTSAARAGTCSTRSTRRSRSGAAAGLPVHVSHLKCETSLVWGRADDLLGRLQDAPDATGDQYPYEAWNSSLSSLLPPWAPGRTGRLARGERPRPAASTRSSEGSPGSNRRSKGSGGITSCSRRRRNPTWRGRPVAEVAEDRGIAPFDAIDPSCSPTDPEISCIGHAMAPADVRTDPCDPDIFVASDASATAPDGPGGDLPVHPRDYGTFPRALAIARDETLLPARDDDPQDDPLPADRFGLTGRGTDRGRRRRGPRRVRSSDDPRHRDLRAPPFVPRGAHGGRGQRRAGVVRTGRARSCAPGAALRRG